VTEEETCGHQWPYLPDEISCDRVPKHTGKHRNLEHHMTWWGGAA
jgi:hypothetical protein